VKNIFSFQMQQKRVSDISRTKCLHFQIRVLKDTKFIQITRYSDIKTTQTYAKVIDKSKRNATDK
jgi:hypothetical protein